MSRKLVILISIAASLLLIVIVLFMGVTTSPRPEPSTPHSIHLLKNKHALRLIEKNELEENLKGRTEEYLFKANISRPSVRVKTSLLFM